MPEEEPLKSLVTFQFILETENIILVEFLLQVQQLSAGLHDWEWCIAADTGIVYQHRYPPIWVES